MVVKPQNKAFTHTEDRPAPKMNTNLRCIDMGTGGLYLYTMEGTGLKGRKHRLFKNSYFSIFGVFWI